ncbi:ScyD/ScyE family protein [Pseudarthrobacter sp. NamB4]|uniref:ScyD/ScyE family protein n=1 Tax=Pseudarthrobacter sp. NamB4 TaxID=2576837 RepID=UPI0010FD4B27|nr:ScyD/ScyE family protein [Pseudarthrobacter sp. NamB4]TLM74111.1 ScyD/ScyE family protein [Pseudarthrobacter sp. NamB4]
MKTKIPIVAWLAAALLVIPAGPAMAGSDLEHSTPRTLAEGLVGPLSLTVTYDESVLVTQNFAGLLSHVNDDGSTTTLHQGEEGWSVGGVETRHGTRYFVESAGAGGTDPAALKGWLKSLDPQGAIHDLADLASYEREKNPDGAQHYGFGPELSDACLAEWPAFPPARYQGGLDSHPYGVAVRGDKAYIADAGANAILEVDLESGDVSTLAVLPPQPAVIPAGTRIPVDMAGNTVEVPACVVGHEYAFEPVPTDLEFGPDGRLYVTTLPGGPEDPSLGARGAIFRVNASTGGTKVWAKDILSPTGLAIADDGDVYVASMFGNEIIEIDASTYEKKQFLAIGGPAAVEIRGNSLYATVGFSFADPTQGKVIKAGIW